MYQTADDLRALNSPDKIAEAGEKIYLERHKASLEPAHKGEFVAIDVVTGEGYVGRFPEEAIQRAKEAAPHAVLHLIRIGAPGAFKVSYTTRDHDWWSRSFRRAG